MKKYIILYMILFCCWHGGYCQGDANSNFRTKNIIDFDGKDFSFAIVADPQVSGKNHNGHVGVNAANALEQATEEINDLEEKVLFTVFLGDFVNTFNQPSVENFKYRIRNLKSIPVLTHGNHDTRPPYTDYKALSMELMGFDEMFYSYDVGGWHFIVLPCNFNSSMGIADEILIWLEDDLKNNSKRPTIVLEHLPIVPLGLSQLEWYTFDMDLRREFLNLLPKYGNVKYYFNGHVHNGIKSSVKMALEYKGIKFITVPSIIQGRPFGEEYPEYEAGIENGGYYMLVYIKGDKVELEGKLVNNKNSFIYPSNFTKLTEGFEPRWFKTISEFKGSNFKNGDFSRDLNGWYKNFRYQSDFDPAYVYEKSSFQGRDAAYIFTKSKPPSGWANDERSEMYQVISLKKINQPFLEIDYAFDKKTVHGGGYIRLTAFNDQGHEFLMFFRWGAKEEYAADYVPRSVGFELEGKNTSWNYLSELASEKRAMFFDLDESVDNWHELKVNIPEIYNKAIGKPGAYENLKISKIYLGLATWCNKPLDAASGAYFSNIKLYNDQTAGSTINGKPFAFDETIFRTNFGKGLNDRIEKRNALVE